MGNQTAKDDERVIATVSVWKTLREVCLNPGMWFFVFIIAPCYYIVLNVQHPGHPITMAIAFCAGACLLVLILALALLCVTGSVIAIHRGQLRAYFRLFSRVVTNWAVDLDNIDRIQVHKKGWRSGTIGLVLREWRSQARGRWKRVEAQYLARLGYHRGFGSVYRETLNEIAERIATAVRGHCGRSPTIRLVSPVKDVLYRLPETTSDEDASPRIHELAGHRVEILEVRCIECGYDLRTPAPTDRCPECGSAVERSLQGRHLGVANVAWLKRLQFSCIVLLSGAVAWLVAGILKYGILPPQRLVAVDGGICVSGDGGLRHGYARVAESPVWCLALHVPRTRDRRACP